MAGIAHERRPDLDGSPVSLNIDERMKTMQTKSSSNSKKSANSSGERAKQQSGMMKPKLGKISYINQKKPERGYSDQL